MIDPSRETTAATRFRVAVKDHMLAHGVTQRTVARALGVTEKHMSQVFRGRIRLSFAFAEQIVRQLGLVLDVRVVEPVSPDGDAGVFIDIDGGQVTVTQTTGRPVHVFVNGMHVAVPDRERHTIVVGGR